MNKSIAIILCLMMISIASQASEHGLVAHWKFDEGIGAICSDSSNNAAQGEIERPTWAKGPFGTALYLDGNQAYAILPTPEQLRLTDELTIAIWVLWEQDHTRLPNIITAGWNPGGLQFTVTPASCFFRLGRPGHTHGIPGNVWKEKAVQFLKPIPIKKWVHLAATYKKPIATTYVNGIQVDRQTWDHGINMHPTMHVGKWTVDTHKGLVDDLRLYNRALQPDEISALAQQPGYDKPDFTLLDEKQNQEHLLSIETHTATLAISKQAMITSILQRNPKRELLRNPIPMLKIHLEGGKSLTATQFTVVDQKNGILRTSFPGTPGHVDIKATSHGDYAKITLLDCTMDKVSAITYCQLSPALDTYWGYLSGIASDDESALAFRSLSLLNTVQTPTSPPRLLARVDKDIGMLGASVAIAAARRQDMSAILKAMTLNEDVPKNRFGGAWALDAEEARASYMFAHVSVSNVDRWIRLAKRGAFGYIHLINWWKTLGHYEPDPNLYPKGIEDLKWVADRIRAAGLAVNAHTLSGCIAPNDPWVTPIPSDDFIASAIYTLAKPLQVGDQVLYVNEIPIPEHDLVWSYSGNGNAIKINNEIILYEQIDRSQKPYQFKKLTRGAFNTKPDNHPVADKAHYLQQRYIAFYPKPDSKLADQLAHKICSTFNTIGFQGLYFDGLEGLKARYAIDTVRRKISNGFGRDMFVGGGVGHNGWWTHTQLEAWDHPVWAIRRQHDAHLKRASRIKKCEWLQPHMGWWCPRGPSDIARGYFMDEMEYFGAKNLWCDGPMSLQDMTVSNRPWHARTEEAITLLGWYERIRRAKYFTEETIQKLGSPGQDFRLRLQADGSWKLIPMGRHLHKVADLSTEAARWSFNNAYKTQPIRARIEALYTATRQPNPKILADFADTDYEANAIHYVKQSISIIENDTKGSTKNLRIQAQNTGGAINGAWSCIRKHYQHPYHSMAPGKALGIWVKGDKSNAILNVKIETPREFSAAMSDHYIDLDFEGWRFVELPLRERDAERMGDYVWPYTTTAASYAVVRNEINTSHLSMVALYLNMISPDKPVDIVVSPVFTLPIQKTTIANPTLAINGKKLVLPITMTSGDYVEIETHEVCEHFDERGELIARFKPICKDGIPEFMHGTNTVELTAQPEVHTRRAEVAFFTLGAPFGELNPNANLSFMELDYDIPRTILKQDGIDNQWTCFARASDTSPTIGIDINALHISDTNPGKQLFKKLDLQMFQLSEANDYAQFAQDGETKNGVKRGVTMTLKLDQPTEDIPQGLTIQSTSTRNDSSGWCATGFTFKTPPPELENATSIAAWIKGDASGSILKIQLWDKSRNHLDLITNLDFNGWRQREFPCQNATIDFKSITHILVYITGITTKATATVAGIQAKTSISTLDAPILDFNGKAIKFPVKLKAGQRFHCPDQRNWTIFDGNDTIINSGTLQDQFPKLNPGKNILKLTFMNNPSDFKASVNIVKKHNKEDSRQ